MRVFLENVKFIVQSVCFLEVCLLWICRVLFLALTALACSDGLIRILRLTLLDDPLSDYSHLFLETRIL